MLKSPTLNLMTRIDCRNGNNAEAMNFFNKDDLNPKVVESQKSKGWDRLAIVCKQSLKNDVLFGISTLGLNVQKLYINFDFMLFLFIKDLVVCRIWTIKCLIFRSSCSSFQIL